MSYAGLPRLHYVDPTVDLEATFNVQHLIQPFSEDIIIMIRQVACVPDPPSPDSARFVLHDLPCSLRGMERRKRGVAAEPSSYFQ